MRITIDDETIRQYQLYAASVHRAKPIQEWGRLRAVLNYALADWMEAVGMGHIEDALGIQRDPTLDEN